MIIAETDASVLLTDQAARADQCPDTVQLVLVEGDRWGVDGDPGDPEQLAYVIFVPEGTL